MWGDGEDSIPRVAVDAHRGEVLRVLDDLRTGSAATGTGTGDFRSGLPLDTWYQSSWYYLEDTTRHVLTLTCQNTTSTLAYGYDADNTWADAWTTSAVEAHWAAARTLDYLEEVHGRVGLDGEGGPTLMSSLTGSGTALSLFTDYGTHVVNAYWTGDRAVFGDGDGIHSDPLVSLDIVAHELFHGVTGATAALTSTGEAAQIGESMSDIFGAMVELSVDGEGDDIWKVGEDAWTPSVPGDAMRSLSDPASDGVSYDYRSASSLLADEHLGNGVGNLAFYLAAMGGTHPRYPTFEVAGMGPDAAADIWFRALTSYLTSVSDYPDLREATLSAAEDLYGDTSDQVEAVRDAWGAVGVTDCGGIQMLGNLTGTSTTGGTLTTSARKTLAGTLVGDPATNLDLLLQKKSGGAWTTVASSSSPGATESVSYTGGAGTYRFKVKSISGSGYFYLCQEY